MISKKDPGEVALETIKIDSGAPSETHERNLNNAHYVHKADFGA